ncbi:MAG: LysM peptidoglycan-binding domain-containing protein, partial [Chloroflexi bacterium]|nr:LysM peptidoglycan-binding domain-containing protein [Chloroflexota bacterium]
MRNLIAAVLLAACTLVLTAPQPAAAQDPYAVIDLVNGLRAELGLPAYRVNAELMAAAQAHSEWAASIGTHSHTGAGGSTPRDRATAAGYGGGAPVRVSENIYWGGRATPANAFEWWSNSAIHYQGMTSTNYLDIGAGIATDADGSGYYTLKFGVIIAEAPPPPTAAPEAGLDAEPALPVDPIALAEPNADGSVIHEVGEGQTVWAIAEAYDVPVSEVLALNRLTEDAIIYPGTELIIVPAPVTVEEEPTGPLFHTVQAGQTPLGIALAYGITLEELFAHNGLTEQSVIYPDDEL